MEILALGSLALVVWMVLKLTVKPLWTQHKCLRCGRVFESEDSASAHTTEHAHKTVPL